MVSCHCCKNDAKFKCGDCKSVFYCSEECSTKDWKAHSLICAGGGLGGGPGLVREKPESVNEVHYVYRETIQGNEIRVSINYEDHDIYLVFNPRVPFQTVFARLIQIYNQIEATGDVFWGD